MHSARDRRTHRPKGRRRFVVARRVVTVAVLVAVGLLGWQVASGFPDLRTHLLPSAPSPTELTPEILSRFERAQDAAAVDGIELSIRSGWRSAEEQRRLYDEAVEEHGEEKARSLVLPPERSAHVAGTAIDVSPFEGAQWLEARSEEFGLCRTYENEWWHFEVTGDVGDPCPEMKPDASVDW